MSPFHERVMRLMAEHEMFDGQIWWNPDLSVRASCSDLFYWACADAEPIDESDMDALEQACRDCVAANKYNGDKGPLLWVARKRGMRPQGPFYHEQYCTPGLWPLFDAAGPVRPDSLAPHHTTEI